MLTEKPPQLPCAEAKPVREAFDVVIVQSASLDQRQRTRDRVGRAAPEREFRRCLGPAAQTRAEACLLCRRRRGVEADILELRGARRTYRPAVDARRLD